MRWPGALFAADPRTLALALSTVAVVLLIAGTIRALILAGAAARRTPLGSRPLSLRVSLLVLVLATGCATQNRWVTMAGHDVEELVTAPAHASAGQWQRAALVTGVVATTFALDDTMRDIARANTSARAEDISEGVTPFGGRYSDRVLVGFLAAGLAFRNDKAKAVAFDGLVSSVFASKVITPALKEITRRERPNGTDEDSFPSNHATQAFAIASVIAGHYDSPWVDAAAYGMATLVGASRIYDDVHWTSDVVAGAVIGTVTGKFIVATNRRHRATWTVTPIYDARRRGVLFTRSCVSRAH